MAFAFRDPNNPAAAIFWTGNTKDPMIPAGYVFCYSDGAYDVPQKTNEAGVNSGGWPPYTGDASQLAAQPKWPNGLISSTSGNKTTA